MTTGRRVIPWYWTLLMVLVICACGLADAARAQVVSVPGNEETDRAALAAFYHATNGPNWKNSENWLSDLPLATWYGVTVHSISWPGYPTIRRLASLNLPDNGLTGSLPSEFAQLVTLQRLDLSDNALTRDIPTVLGELDIEVLGQSVLSPGADPCHLTVYYPDGYRAGFGDSCIHYLDLSNNQFTGPIPISFRHFYRLQQLDLSHNQLTGSIPAELGEMDHDGEFSNYSQRLVCSWSYCVYRLDLSHNQLTGIVPEELGNLRGLQVLNLSHNTPAVQRFRVTVSEGCTNDLGAVSGTVTRTGSWTSDCTSVHYSGPRYARYYSFTLLRSSPMRIDLMSSVDTLLALRNGSGTGSELVEANDDIGGGNLNSRIETTLPAGTYTIEATTFYPFVTGSFTLTLSVGLAFTDHPLVPGVTPVKAVHFTELRTRINGVLTALGGLVGGFTWTDPVLSAGVTRVRLVHLLELRTAVEAAYSASGQPVPSWSDATPTAGTTPIRAVHLMELRAAVVTLETGVSSGSQAIMNSVETVPFGVGSRVR